MHSLAPRCGRPMGAYETPGVPVTGKYDAGAAIRQAREDAGMTRRQLAEACGVSVKAVRYWEDGERYPTSAAAALEGALGVVLGGPVCGRPAGHNGDHVSEESWCRKLAADRNARRRSSGTQRAA